MRKLYFFTIALVIGTFFNLNAQTLLAEYPLVSDGVDITGNNGDMTIHKAPFQNGGIYSNGIYYGSDTNGSLIQTPQINNFNFDDLTVKVEFLLEEYPENQKPILMIGGAWRWLSAWMQGDKIGLKANNGSIWELTDVIVSLNGWHSVTVSYNKSEEKVWLHLDDELILTVDVAELDQGDNSSILNEDNGTGNTFKGYWKNLEVHNTAVVAGIGNNTIDDISVATRGSYLDIIVPEGKGNIQLQIVDISGKQLGIYNLSEGLNSLNIESAKSLKILLLKNQDGQQTVKKVILGN